MKHENLINELLKKEFQEVFFLYENSIECEIKMLIINGEKLDC